TATHGAREHARSGATVKRGQACTCSHIARTRVGAAITGVEHIGSAAPEYMVGTCAAVDRRVPRARHDLRRLVRRTAITRIDDIVPTPTPKDVDALPAVDRRITTSGKNLRRSSRGPSIAGINDVGTATAVKSV